MSCAFRRGGCARGHDGVQQRRRGATIERRERTRAPITAYGGVAG
jgi:hypothetical protein